MTWEYITKSYLLDGVDPTTEKWNKNILKIMIDKINTFIEPIIEKTKLNDLEDIKIRGFRLKCIKDALKYIYNSDAFYKYFDLKYKPKSKEIICEYIKTFCDDEIIEAYGVTEYTADTCDDCDMLVKVFEYNVFDVFQILRLINSVINELNNL